MKCIYCNKTFKTEKGFEKHCCEKKKRFLSFDDNAFNLWRYFMQVTNIRVSKDENKLKISFISSTLYSFFMKLSIWVKDMDLLDPQEFIKYCYYNKIPQKNWASDSNYVNYVHYYINNEHPIIACNRSKEYLKSINIDIHSISQNRLFFSLLGGKISKKYLAQECINPNLILDKGQINQLGDLI